MNNPTGEGSIEYFNSLTEEELNVYTECLPEIDRPTEFRNCSWCTRERLCHEMITSTGFVTCYLCHVCYVSEGN